MFRGGRVSSYGTGIAAPLVPGYAGGGQIGGGIIYGKPMADGRYGFKEPEKVGMELLEENIPNFGDKDLETRIQIKEYLLSYRCTCGVTLLGWMNFCHYVSSVIS